MLPAETIIRRGFVPSTSAASESIAADQADGRPRSIITGRDSHTEDSEPGRRGNLGARYRLHRQMTVVPICSGRTPEAVASPIRG